MQRRAQAGGNQPRCAVDDLRMDQTKTALRIIWAVVSIAVLLVLAAPFLLPAEKIACCCPPAHGG